MKNLSYGYFLIVVFFTTSAYAQNQDYKWSIGVGGHAVDYTSVRGLFDGYFDTNDYSISPLLTKLSVTRNISKHFTVDLEVSVGEVENKRLASNGQFYMLGGLGLRYNILGGKSKWFDPYLRIGANYHKGNYEGVTFDNTPSWNEDETKVWDVLNQSDVVGYKNNFAVDGGIGLNFWITKRFGLNVESQYVWVPSTTTDYFDHFQHSASLVFRFGPKKDIVPPPPPPPEEPCANKGGDTDGDGICNADDLCPDVVNDLTDTDGDGVIDCADACPNNPAITKGECINEIDTIIDKKIKGLLFDTDKATLKKSELTIIDDIANYINSLPANVNFYVDGHTDTTGSTTYNYQLSGERVATVIKALEAKGVSASRLTARAFGEEDLACPEEGKTGTVLSECRQQNRRVVMWDVKDTKAPAAIPAPTK